MALSTPDYRSRFTDYFHMFMSRIFNSYKRSRYPSTLRSLTSTDLDESVIKEWCIANSKLFNPLDCEQSKIRSLLHQQLCTAIDETAFSLQSVRLEHYLPPRISIDTLQGPYRVPESVDFFYLKINHGFWEQIYALFGSPDPYRMRIKNPAELRSPYVYSGLLDALTHCFLCISRIGETRVEFPIHLALSIVNGRMDHQTALRTYRSLPLEKQYIRRGAAIGMCGFFQTLFGNRQIFATDGCFPRMFI
jgi:hypothetical protein